MPSLSEADRAALLQLARQAVVDAVAHNGLPEEIPNRGIFAERHGVFVTLRAGRHLRGCIGVIEGDQPLGETIVRCAADAALQDRRFAPMQTGEIASLQIEISLLSPPVPMDPTQIEIGRHGLIVSRGKLRGLLLPQVAVEHHLTPEQFLDEVCKKAQFEPAAWRNADTQVLAFTCEVFSDQQDVASR